MSFTPVNFLATVSSEAGSGFGAGFEVGWAVMDLIWNNLPWRL